jgi:hypothetical protein
MNNPGDPTAKNRQTSNVGARMQLESEPLPRSERSRLEAHDIGALESRRLPIQSGTIYTECANVSRTDLVSFAVLISSGSYTLSVVTEKPEACDSGLREAGEVKTLESLRTRKQSQRQERAFVQHKL